MSAQLAPVADLICGCCGARTRGRQHWNIDAGYGLCPKCAAWFKESPKRLEELACYGTEGINFGVLARTMEVPDGYHGNKCVLLDSMVKSISDSALFYVYGGGLRWMLREELPLDVQREIWPEAQVEA